MDLYPAIDIRDGGAVRLTQGDFDRQSDYGDPVALATRFASGGAPWLHVVDLDAARSGHPVNRSTVLAIAGAVPVPVETGGGVRAMADVAELLDGGVTRVVIGTAALDDPDLVRQATAAYPGRTAVPKWRCAAGRWARAGPSVSSWTRWPAPDWRRWS